MSAAIERIDVHAALVRQQAGARIIDVREVAEWAAGTAPGAQLLPKSRFEACLHELPGEGELLLLCAAGMRATACAQALARCGARAATVIDGGFRAWQAAGLPVHLPDDADAAWLRRYARQIVLPEVGIAGQRRLAEARVLLIGAGGLGSPVALYLAAAGLGTLRVVDDDCVEESNLQRQVIHTSARVGTPKVSSAATTLTALNPGLVVEGVQQRVSAANVDALVEGCTLIVDGSDNLPTRYLLSDACVKHALPLVYAAVERYSGQVGVFHPASARGSAPCYRCLFPEPPPPEQAPNCAEVGVLGVLPGLLGLQQANEAIKLLLGIGEPLIGRLLLVDALGARFRELRLPADPACSVCAPGREFPGYVDYAAFCAGH